MDTFESYLVCKVEMNCEEKKKCQEYLQSFLLEQVDGCWCHRNAGGRTAGFREKYYVK